MRCTFSTCLFLFHLYNVQTRRFDITVLDFDLLQRLSDDLPCACFVIFSGDARSNRGYYNRHKTVIDLCVKQGVKRYIPPDFGARSDNDTVVERVPVVAMKKRVTEYLQTKETEGLAWTSVICGAFLDS